jgi:hypothetical protein
MDLQVAAGHLDCHAISNQTGAHASRSDGTGTRA